MWLNETDVPRCHHHARNRFGKVGNAILERPSLDEVLDWMIMPALWISLEQVQITVFLLYPLKSSNGF